MKAEASRKRNGIEGEVGGAAPSSRPGHDPRGREPLLIIARELVRGGAAYLALRHARRLAPRYAIDVLVTGPYDDDFLAEFPDGVRVFPLDGPPLRRDLPGRDALHGFALDHAGCPPFRRRYRAALATSTFPDLSACAAVCTVWADRRMVFLVDESLSLYPDLDPLEREIVGQSILGADLVLPVSRRLWYRMADHFPPLRSRPWQALQPPVEVEAVLAAAREPQSVITPVDVPNVLSIGRLSPEKQVPLCVRVHHRLKQEGVRFRWYVVGVGPEEAQTREEISRLGMEDDFILLGKQANVYSLLGACDVFALISLSEGCPTVVLEALALGRPVLMTEVNGSYEMIDYGMTGSIAGHHPDSIAAGLAQLVQDADLRRRYRDNLAGRAASLEAGAGAGVLADLIATPSPASAAPRVSVLIPTFNQEPYIARAIVSALAQDHPSLEVVVLDDASTDGTGDQARAWLFDRRVRYVRNERNLGRVENYRRGLAGHARGDWVLMLDGDDFLSDPAFLREACASIDRHPDRPVVFAQAGHRVHHPDGRWNDVDVVPPIGADERVLTGGDYLRFVFETAFFTHLGALYNRKLALAVGFYTAPISSSDMDSLLRLALEGDVLLLNRVAGSWVQHGANASSGLALDDFAPNARVFRRVARLAVERGLASWADLDGPLTPYEARTLVYFFDTLMNRSPLGPGNLARFLRVALAVNPSLLRDETFLAGLQRFWRALVNPVLESSGPGRLAQRAVWRLRAAYRRRSRKAPAGAP